MLGRQDDLGVYFEISGPVEPSVPIGGERTRAAVAWAWLADGELGGVVTEAPFEPRVYQYALDVERPPDPTDATSVGPSDLGAPGLVLLFGLPVLYEPPDDQPARLQVDPVELLAWAAGDRPDLAGVVEAVDPGVVVAGATDEHLLVLMSTDDGATRLATAPQWVPGSGLCRLDAVLAGLTLYRSTGDGCSGWDPLAPAGTRTAFQGVPMRPLP